MQQDSEIHMSLCLHAFKALEPTRYCEMKELFDQFKVPYEQMCNNPTVITNRSNSKQSVVVNSEKGTDRDNSLRNRLNTKRKNIESTDERRSIEIGADKDQSQKGSLRSKNPSRRND